MTYAHQPDQLDDGDFACPAHVGDDDYLGQAVRDWVAEDPDASGTCGLCADTGMPVEQLLDLIDGGVAKFFERAEDSQVYLEDDWLLSTSSAEEVLYDLGIDENSPLFYAAVEHMGEGPWVEHDWGWPSHQRLMSDAWQAFVAHITHRSRFLFETDKTMNTFGGLDQLGTRDFLRGLVDALSKRQIRVEDTDSQFFRARAIRLDKHPPATADEYASPPPEKASQGRMNPAGIAYFYGALDPATAAVEVYGGDTYAALATFQPTRQLRLVDLTKVELPSPFDDSVTLEEHHRALFLIGFASDISKPVIRDERVHQEYVPTQAVTEYIRFRSKPPVDGLLFSSARTSGTNVVIFADQDRCLGRGTDPLLTPLDAMRRFDFGAPTITEGKPSRLTPAPLTPR